MNEYSNNLFESPYENNEEYLAHFGVRGMKWGIRRYQNRDGTYTSLGKRRRRDGDTSNYSAEYKEAHSGKDYRTMSNEELQRVNNRLNLERNYKQNTAPVQSQPQYSEGQKFVQQVLKTTATTTISAIAGATIVAVGKNWAQNLMKGDTDTATGAWDALSDGKKLMIGAAAAGAVAGTAAYAYHQKKPKQNNC